MRRWIAVAGVAVLLLIVVVGAGAAVIYGNALGEKAAGDVRPGPGGQGATQIVIQDNTFQPGSVQVDAGVPATFELTNAGQSNHNFTSTDLNVSTGPMKPGDVMTVTATVLKGTTQFVCTWHPGMVIEIIGK
jgi:plastocyanin